jgi:rhamnogalacturonyl hydrolase YesR
MELTRRTFFGIAAAAAQAASQGRVPPPVAAIISRTLKQSPAEINTDWFGTCLMKGLLDWRDRIPEAKTFAKAWLEYHLASNRISPFSGNRSRPITAGGIHITTYVGHFGLALPCYQLFEIYEDPRARQVAVDIADIILHKTARNRLGMTAHDDTAEFAIPDTCYFAVAALMVAARMTGQAVYRDQAVYQVRTYTDTFLDRDKGIAKTILLKKGLGKTYWTRATGWLLWSITVVLRHLPPADPAFRPLTADLRALAEGIARAQDAGGGLRLYLDDPASQLETTGTAMCAEGLHEAIRKDWIPGDFSPVAARAWQYVQGKLTADGDIKGAYTGWAVPAEEGEVDQFDHVKMGWIPGFVLGAAAELTGALRS